MEEGARLGRQEERRKNGALGKGGASRARDLDRVACVDSVGTRVIRADSCAAEMAPGVPCAVRINPRMGLAARLLASSASIRPRMRGHARETRADTQIGSIVPLSRWSSLARTCVSCFR